MTIETASTLAAVEKTKRHLREQLDKCNAAISEIRNKNKMTKSQKKQLEILENDRDIIGENLRGLVVGNEEEEEESDAES